MNNLTTLILIAIISFMPNGDCNEMQTILGKWSNEIVIPPSPQVHTNPITFSVINGRNIFEDKNKHTGTWKIKGDSIMWFYENVPNLVNTFAGRVSTDGKTMEGVNYGTWNGKQFKGSWKAVKLE